MSYTTATGKVAPGESNPAASTEKTDRRLQLAAQTKPRLYEMAFDDLTEPEGKMLETFRRWNGAQDNDQQREHLQAWDALYNEVERFRDGEFLQDEARAAFGNSYARAYYRLVMFVSDAVDKVRQGFGKEAPDSDARSLSRAVETFTDYDVWQEVEAATWATLHGKVPDMADFQADPELHALGFLMAAYIRKRRALYMAGEVE